MDQAREYIERLDDVPEDLRRLGLFYLTEGNQDEAIHFYFRAYEKDTTDADSIVQVIRVLQLCEMPFARIQQIYSSMQDRNKYVSNEYVRILSTRLKSGEISDWSLLVDEVTKILDSTEYLEEYLETQWTVLMDGMILCDMDISEIFEKATEIHPKSSWLFNWKGNYETEKGS